MNRIRTRLLLVFLAGTLIPLGITLAVTWRLLEYSIAVNPSPQLELASHSLQQTGRALYQATCDALRAEVRGGHQRPAQVWSGSPEAWPAEVRDFAEADEPERFQLTGERRDRVDYLVRDAAGRVAVYTRLVGGPGLQALTDQLARSRALVARGDAAMLRRGYTVTLIVIAIAAWGISFTALFWLARRIARPMEQLTEGLQRLAGGDLSARLEPQGSDEVAAAMLAFNYTARQLSESQEKLVQVTRVASWQNLARKMAHEVKNSLTPIRLTVEEIVARRREPEDQAFLEQAAQIVIDEIGTLERRVRAFTDLASEPPVQPEAVDVNELLAERFALLRAAHPDVLFDAQPAPGLPPAWADPDLVKGVITNLLDNAAYAVGRGGVVLGRTYAAPDDRVAIEIHDSGPGLSAQARSTLFEPTISFRKSGMGLGLSIAKRSAMLVGGDLILLERGDLSGAAFRVLLPCAHPEETNPDHAVASRAYCG